MKLPYVIDKQTNVFAEILKALLSKHQGCSLDVATAYFTVGGFGLVQEGLATLGNFRLLLGAEPTSGEQVGLRPDAVVVRGLRDPDRDRISQLKREDLRLICFDILSAG